MEELLAIMLTLLTLVVGINYGLELTIFISIKKLIRNRERFLKHTIVNLEFDLDKAKSNLRGFEETGARFFVKNSNSYFKKLKKLTQKHSQITTKLHNAKQELNFIQEAIKSED